MHRFSKAFPLFFLITLLFVSNSCRQSDRRDAVRLNLDQRTDKAIANDNSDVVPLRVALSTVISPRESYAYYQELFEALSRRLDRPIEFKQRQTYQEVNDMLAQNLVDIAFICSGAYALGRDHFELLAVPVVNGEPRYRGYLIVAENSQLFRFEDLKGKRFSYSDPLCFTGKLFVDKRLLAMGTKAEDFFSEVVFSLSHDISIQMVSRGMVDGASVNGLIFEYMLHYHPEQVQNIRIIEKTEANGIPPVVNSLLLSRELRSEIQEFFTGMHHDPELQPVLEKLLIDRFILAGDSLYQALIEHHNIP